MRSGVDCSTRITPAIAKEIVKAGHSFVIRYLVPSTYDKWLSPEEAQIISDAGLDIGSVFETTAARALDGFNAGVQDAHIAVECAHNVKQPTGDSAIYFAVDFDETKPEQLDAIEQYLRGASSVIVNFDYGLGDYGEFDVVETMLDRGVTEYSWQTYAWSAKKLSKRANIYQFKNGQTVGGIEVDLNNSFGHEGFWNLRKGAITMSDVFSDVPADHWCLDSLKLLKDEGILVGFPDGMFKGNQSITRYDLAHALAAMYIKLKG